MDIKASYRHFRQWQQEPFEHEFATGDTHQCNNCDHEFVGNFCPYCSQKSDIGPITWESVAKGIGELWGLHNRSLLYSLVQLFLRPGYFVGDYISGKRQVSFPPVKMLAIISVLGVIVDFLTGAIHGMVKVSKNGKLGYINDVFTWFNVHINGAFPPPSDYLNNVFMWLNTHPDLLSLILLSFLIIPNYFIFRFAPRNPHHTLPQGFFIQVFSSALFLILNMLYDITAQGVLVITLGYIMVFTTYKQLFGYGVWGTLWRVAIAFACAFTMLSVLLNTSYAIHLMGEHQTGLAWSFILNIPIALVSLFIVLLISYVIGKMGWRRRAKRVSGGEGTDD